MKYKILLLVPSESASGGINNYFQVLKNKFSIHVEYMIRGARSWPYRSSLLMELNRAFVDLKLFRQRIAQGDIGLVQTSTSLGVLSIIRDGLFIYYTSKKGVKTIVFFSGWNVGFEKRIDRFFLTVFKFFYFRADNFIVLASQFRSKLQEWGYNKKIFIETTIIDERLISEIDINTIKNAKQKRKNRNQYNLLFLARVEVAKGVYEAIDTYRIIKKNNINKNISLIIAGSGKELSSVRSYVKTEELEGIKILGFVDGNDKQQCFLNADIYLFPTYTEGMPNSVLEAMAFGLPIITRNVGAIPDIIEIEENGFYTNSKESMDFAGYIQRLMLDNELSLKIMENNYNKAIDNYITSTVIERIEKIYKETLNETTDTTA